MKVSFALGELGVRIEADFLDSWNYEAVQKAWDEHTPENEKGVAVYAASKTEAERQAHKWIEQHKPQFQFNTVLPCFIVRFPYLRSPWQDS